MNRWILGLALCTAPAFGWGDDTPKWLENWSLKGDFRVRGEGIEFDREDRKTRNRARYRFRIGAQKKISDRLGFGFRLASGSGDPTSTNETFDNSFSGKDIVIDRAFFTYKKSGWTLGAGKHENPFHCTDIVWDSDVNPEGFYQKYDNKRFFLTLGESFVEEESSGPDTNLYAAQAGLKGEAGPVAYKVSGAYYLYKDLALPIIGATDYRFVDLVADVSFVSGVPVSLTLDFVKNTTSEVEAEDTAWAVFAQIGEDDSPGAWWGTVKYAEIELLSVNGAFADSDFGFSDVEGFVVDLNYRASKHVAARLAVFSVDSILATDNGFNRVQLDCSLKF